MTERLMLTVLVAAVVAVVVARLSGRTAAVAPQPAAIVVARVIEVIDGTGKPRIVMTCDEHGPVVELYGEDKKERAILGVNKLGDAVLALFDGQGRERAKISAEVASSAALSIFDTRHFPSAMLKVTDPHGEGHAVTMLQLNSGTEGGGISIGEVEGVTAIGFKGHNLDTILGVMATPTSVEVTDPKSQHVIWRLGNGL